jgi:DNA-directed RNA polymerase specialized sigma24 family protein
MRDAEELLKEWGTWTWQGAGVPRCTSPMYALMRDNVEQISPPVAAITDDDAMMIDRIVAAMGKRYPKMAECVVVYYRLDVTMEEAGKIVKLNRLKVREMLIAAKAYVDACLDMRAAA